jgi:hypothetical protein
MPGSQNATGRRSSRNPRAIHIGKHSFMIYLRDNESAPASSNGQCFPGIAIHCSK